MAEAQKGRRGEMWLPLFLSCAYWRRYLPAHLADWLYLRRLTAQGRVWHSSFRGHPVIWFEREDCDRYADSLSCTRDAQGQIIERPCGHCGLTSEPDGPDICLGMLPRVHAACCGHGVKEPYVAFCSPFGRRSDSVCSCPISAGNWDIIRGKEALAFFKHQDVGPCKARPPARTPMRDTNGTDA